MKSITIKNNNNEEKAIEKAVLILKKTLKRGDIILTKPRLHNIKLKIKNFPSFLIGSLTKGITHSCLYLGKGNILDIGSKFYDRDIKKITLEKLLKNKMSIFKGLTVYVVQPKNYKEKHRKEVFRIAINNFLNKSRELTFSYFNIFKIAVKSQLTKSKFIKKERLDFKEVWNCADLVAYALKKSGVKIGNRKTKFFAPSTFLFSKHFKTKKKVILK
jgi:hypothetical protein